MTKPQDMTLLSGLVLMFMGITRGPFNRAVSQPICEDSYLLDVASCRGPGP